MKTTPDVLLIGGGVMGCASALALAESGLRVVVLERSVPGAEASSAAAGILGAQAEAHEPGPFFELARLSLDRYPSWAERLGRATGIDVGYRACGALRVAFADADAAAIERGVAWQREVGLAVERLDTAALALLEPALAARGAVLFAGDGRIDPPLLLRALQIAARAAGAQFQTGAYVRAIDVEKGAVRGVSLEDGSRLSCENVVLAAGSWSTLVGGVPLSAGAVRPARGQIVELETPSPPLGRVVFGPRCYLVPRDDGRILIGSTLEFVGYRREVTARAVRDLLDAAIELVPSLADAAIGRMWSSFRPYTGGLPFLGPTEVRGLVLATGHHRNGILLAPITAEIVRGAVRGEKSPIDLLPFAPPAP
ncbi:MAG TPA: glycine oxidase ThiO [Polyangiaceae bacterium]